MSCSSRSVDVSVDHLGRSVDVLRERKSERSDRTHAIGRGTKRYEFTAELPYWTGTPSGHVHRRKECFDRDQVSFIDWTRWPRHDCHSSQLSAGGEFEPDSIFLRRQTCLAGQRRVHHISQSLLHRHRSGNERDLQQSTHLHTHREFLLPWYGQGIYLLGSLWPGSPFRFFPVDQQTGWTTLSREIHLRHRDRSDHSVLQLAVLRTIIRTTSKTSISPVSFY